MANDSGVVRYEARGHSAWITIDHPAHANSLTASMINELSAAWSRANDDARVRVVIVTGAGDRHFCAGGDRRQLASQTLRRVADEPHRYTALQAGVRKPVIAAVNGAAAGAGMTIALEADIVLATRSAEFLDPHTRLGLVVAGGPLAIARGVPFSEIAMVAIAGKSLSAERAHQLGVVAELAEDADQVRRLASAYAERVVAQSPTAVQVSLALLRRFRRDEQVESILADAAAAAAEQWAHPDASEGTRAMLEGRPPNWA
jgi:enoyl-CoA hydratase/carnithine racemase